MSSRERYAKPQQNKGPQQDVNDFPIICQHCIGESSFVRMTKATLDEECKLCMRPFTVYRWRPGREGRMRKTEVCQSCARLKNVCQVCMLDLEYGLPVGIRDLALSRAGLDVEATPLGLTNREIQQELQDRDVESGRSLDYTKLEPTTVLMRLAKTDPYFRAKQPDVCSFWLKGKCNRGAKCPYRHEIPKGASSAVQQQREEKDETTQQEEKPTQIQQNLPPSTTLPSTTGLTRTKYSSMDPQLH